MHKLCLLVAALCRGRRLTTSLSVVEPSPRFPSVSAEPCNCSTYPSRRRSSWCEQEGHLDEFISFTQIQTGRGLCLDGKCYDENSLRKWLYQHTTLPHNRAPFNIASLDMLLGVDPTTITADSMIWSICFDALGRLVTGTIRGLTQVWSLETGAELLRFPQNNSALYDPILRLQVAADDRTLLSANLLSGVHLWDIINGNETFCFDSIIELVTSAEISPDGGMILLACYDFTVRVFERTGCSELMRFGSDSQHVIVSAGFRPPQGSDVFMALNDGTVILMNLETGFEKTRFSVSRAPQLFSSFKFNSDGTKIIASADFTYVIDVDTQRTLASIHGRTAAFGLNESKVLACSHDGDAFIWDIEASAEIKRFSQVGGACHSVAFSPDGSKVVIGFGSLALVADVD